MIIAPRIATFVMLLLLLLAVIEHYARRGLPRHPPAFEAAFLVVVAFAGWAMLSALWSPAPWHSLLKPVFMVLIAVAVWFALRTVSTASRPFAHYFGEGAITGIAVGYLLVCFEIVTDQLITRTIMSAIPATHENISKHVTVDVHGTVTDVTNANLNRRMAILTWLLWPAIMLALHDPSRIRRWIALVTVIGGAGIILVFGSHQSSQIAILGGVVVYGLASINLPATRIALASVWSIAVVFALPIALMMSSANLHNADWLFKSARHRVVIWSTTAEEALKSPVLGVGADATRTAMHAAMKRSESEETLGRMMVGYANHAHNAYLQVWYELGAIGAALFLAIGLFALRVIARLKTALQPSAIALFVTTSLLIAFSYSIWQTWFIAALGFAIVVFGVAARKRADQIAHPGTADVPEKTTGSLVARRAKIAS
ncbi:MAG: hypothetical protein APF80_02690 [Alphaproteobacteria bacterium BRH_c36]|nr:MAG: hypothetical protein APF80_02690 [Alphaproteobacteria bacterium BRH_c36]